MNLFCWVRHPPSPANFRHAIYFEPENGSGRFTYLTGSMPVERPPNVYDEVSDRQTRPPGGGRATKACGLRPKRKELKMDTFDDELQKMHAMLASLNAEIDALIERAENAWPDLKVGGETAGKPSRRAL